MSDKRSHLYRTGSDKDGPVEMAKVIKRLMAAIATDDDDDATDVVVEPKWVSDLARLESAYIGVVTPSRAEITKLPDLLAEGERVSLITNCRRERDYGALVATDSRTLFVWEGDDGAVATASWPHIGTERVEHGAAARGSLAYVQLHTTDGVVQIDALDIDGARQAAEFLQSKAGASTGAAARRELAGADKGAGARTGEQAVGVGDGAGDEGVTAAGAGENQDARTGEQVAGAGDGVGDDGVTAAGAGENQGARTGEPAAGAGENQDARTSEHATGVGDGAGDDGGTVAGVGENQGALTGEQAAQLQSLEALRDSGILSAEEFERMRARIYDREAERAAQLQSIEALRDSGILSAEEFERMRARIYETG